ncbi:hypothetical protein ACJMK2_019349 [Sinanodonta woodiana]|uniref:Uncharacterized protein n=1 Tax=Sinanodonta woodiana TaxID=1069815 RepID=A0ABD3UJS8_SINWO
MTQIPNSIAVSWSYSVIDLRSNQIYMIQKNNFLNVNVSEIRLDGNLIHTIENNSFINQRNDLRKLDLKDNKLTYLPSELGTLNKLEYLDLRGNPISSFGFDDTIMRQMGDYMRTFYFGHEQLDNWPNSVRHFQQLRQLELNESVMSELPISAFQGFEWTLRELTIRHTKLISVPIALQYVHSVEVFHFDDNVLVGDAGILAPAFAGMMNTTTNLSLENDGLTDFPDILLTLQKVENLSLARNRLEFVSDSSVQKIASTKLTILNLEACELDRIPGALSQLTSLRDLDLSYNRIYTIERNDLQQLNQLVNLTLSYNDVGYISDSSFKGLSALRKLELRNSNLTIVPEAIKNIPNLDVLDLTNTYPRFPRIECNCERMIWLYQHLKALRDLHKNLTIYGECETITDGIENYAWTRVCDYCITCQA